MADIVSTWLEKGEDRPTLCFAVDRAHAKKLQQQFQEAGVDCGYMDAFTDIEEREQIAKQFADGDLRVVCNVGVLTTGIDWDVRCIILARPTRSEILYTQIIGRGLRTANGKDDCLILDHSDTTLKLGFVTDIHHDRLHSGEKNANTGEKKIRLPKPCPKCAYIKPAGSRECPSCGFAPTITSKVETEDGELLELTGKKEQLNKTWTRQAKENFYAELLGYARQKGYKDGWAYHAYRQRIGVGPPNRPIPLAPSAATLSWIRHLNIARAKQRDKENGFRNGSYTRAGEMV